MKIAIIHGYLLSGTGSNIYVANLVAGLVARGHDVFLFCQEPQPKGFQFIDECYDFEADNRRFLPVFSRRGPGPGRARLFRPRIGDILPVYVLDEYHGFTAREFHRLPALEIENYVARNAQAVKTVHEAFGLEVVQANHLIASPAVARRALEQAGVPYNVTVHGSALNYSVRRNSGLNHLALYGLEKAASVSASSRFLGKQLNDYLVSVGRPKVRVNIIYPGVELALFQPADDRAKSVVGLTKQLETLRKIDWKDDRVVMFVGKYLAAKGLHASILAAPLVRARRTRARFLAIGLSDERELYKALVAALAAGDGRLVCDLVREIEKADLPPVGRRYLANLKRRGKFADYLQAAQAADLTGSFLFTGPLDHAELAQLLPAADLSVSPSIFPEAFGMVAVEALAAGVWPIVTEDFGMAEIAKICQAHFSGRFTPLPRLKLDGRFVNRLSETIIAALAEPYLGSRRFKEQAHRLAMERFSWERVVEDYLKLFGRRRRGVA
ncbi:MAG: glycosyltransferase family 4 protein [Actinomycetota bacterium]|nr:glycosyltransferase family 4 protein [Actinomycetota bacterium]